MSVVGAWLVRLFSALLAIWSGIPQKQKDRIIEAVVESFTAVLGYYWDKSKKKMEAEAESGRATGATS